MTKSKGLSEWITTAQAAELLGMTQRNVRYLITSGKLDAQKIAERLVVSRSSLDSYIAQRDRPKEKDKPTAD